MKKAAFLMAILLVCLAFILYACVATGKKQYDIGMQLSQAGKEKEAIAYLEQAIADEPQNQQYQQALADLKERLVNKYVSAASQALESQMPLTIAALNEAKEEFAKAQEIYPSHPAVINFQKTHVQQQQPILYENKSL
jgi:tetratricopeptide (TPR) repeat protein